VVALSSRQTVTCGVTKHQLLQYIFAFGLWLVPRLRLCLRVSLVSVTARLPLSIRIEYFGARSSVWPLHRPPVQYIVNPQILSYTHCIFRGCCLSMFETEDKSELLCEFCIFGQNLVIVITYDVADKLTKIFILEKS